MRDFDTTVHALRRWAASMDRRDQAAVDLLAWHESWLRRADFTTAAVENRGVHLAINWRKAREFYDSGPGASTSQLAILDLAVTLAEDRFRFGIMGDAHSQAIVRAVAQALGEDR
jgi:hypothetical protein